MASRLYSRVLVPTVDLAYRSPLNVMLKFRGLWAYQVMSKIEAVVRFRLTPCARQAVSEDPN